MRNSATASKTGQVQQPDTPYVYSGFLAAKIPIYKLLDKSFVEGKIAMILILIGLGGITYAVITAILDHKKRSKNVKR